MEIGVMLEQLVIRNLINTFILLKDLAMLALLAEVILHLVQTRGPGNPLHWNRCLAVFSTA